MSIFRFVTEGSPNKKLPSLIDAKKLAVLIQTPSDIQEVLLSFGHIKVYEYQKSKEEQKELSSYHKSKGSIIEWMRSNPVIMENESEVNGWTLFSFFRETKERLLIRRNEELFDFYDEIFRIGNDFKKDLVFLPHKFSSRLYSTWLMKGKPKKMELTLPDFHDMFEITQKSYYAYTQIEDRILNRVQEIFESVGIKLSYEKNNEKDANYASSEFIFIEKMKK